MTFVVLATGLTRHRSLQTQEACTSVGAMTHSFIKAVECEPRGVTYGRLLTSMKAIMTNGGGSCDLQGPIGAPVRKVANFSGVQVRLRLPHAASLSFLFLTNRDSFCRSLTCPLRRCSTSTASPSPCELPWRTCTYRLRGLL